MSNLILLFLRKKKGNSLGLEMCYIFSKYFWVTAISCTYLYFDLTLTFSSSGHNILEPSYYNVFIYSSILTSDYCIIPISIPCHAMGQTFGEVIYMLSSKCLKQSLLLHSNSLYPYPGPYYGYNSL